ncbi:DUF2935 domain-containing protein [Paenibacillus allorhizosphaerae]|uniref:DUF2935 domain-containing protein n=1 Tax=Paenibacillus allorhizosphaerae TaxID=2849866 RepID=A0ABN7TPZ4_9BACL|nr:DUF2935 domain-containing protein [Paenibacillus allorhizosphaerae]CAG7650539.1 hypothetical protein PAECIP111802_04746 [Paenibacillus allorhizosphaerae]
MTYHPDFVQSALFEHRFWLQILGDHSRFIKDGLSPEEREEIARAGSFVQAFDQLLMRVREEEQVEKVSELTRDAASWTQQLRAFKLYLLHRHLTGKIRLHLSPSFLSHMVNELEEYMRVLGSLLSGQPAPVYEDIHHHLLWLQDAFGHAASIAGELDMAESRLMKTARTFDREFREFYVKAVELAGYMRANIRKFPALSRFNKEVELEMALFQQFLRELEELRLTREALGTLTPLMADHMAREECYYLTKLSQVTELNSPNCDPTKPRTE